MPPVDWPSIGRYVYMAKFREKKEMDEYFAFLESIDFRRLGTEAASHKFGTHGYGEFERGWVLTSVFKKKTYKTQLFCGSFYRNSLQVPNRAWMPMNPWVPNYYIKAYVPNYPTFVGSIF